MSKLDETLKAYTAEHDNAFSEAKLREAQKRAYDSIMTDFLAQHDAGVILSDEIYQKLAEWI